jgi:hypothetical protein
MIGAIKTIYSYYAKDTNVELLVNTWARLLHSYEDGIVEAAFYKCLQTCKVPPTPADVIEQINAMRKALEPSDEDLWAVYNRALIATADQVSRFGYTYVDETGKSQGQQAREKVEQIWQGLPEKIKRYVSSKGELMRAANENNRDASFSTWEKQRFMRAMPTMEKRQENSAMMLSGGADKLLLGGMRNDG